MIYLAIVLGMTTIYSVLWLDVAYKIKSSLIDFSTVQKKDFLSISFNFINYQIKNFPFDIEIHFIKPSISAQFNADIKNKLVISTDVLKAKYPLFSRKVLLFFSDISIRDEKNHTNVSNIKQPLTLEIPLFKNDKKKYRTMYTDDNLLAKSSGVSSSSETLSYINSIIDLTVEDQDKNKHIDAFIKLSDSATKSPFIEYNLNVKIEPSTIMKVKFDVKKIFAAGTNDWSINIGGTFDLIMGSIPELQYIGNLNAYFKNYKNMFAYLSSAHSNDTEVIIKILNDAAYLVAENDLEMQITTKEDKIYFGKLSLDQLMESYAKYSINHIPIQN